MVQSPLNELKEKIDQARTMKRNGGFPSAPKPSISPKEKRVLKGHFGKARFFFASRRAYFFVLTSLAVCVQVYAMHWSGKGNELIVSASQDGKLIVWQAQTTRACLCRGCAQRADSRRAPTNCRQAAGNVGFFPPARAKSLFHARANAAVAAYALLCARRARINPETFFF